MGLKSGSRESGLGESDQDSEKETRADEPERTEETAPSESDNERKGASGFDDEQSTDIGASGEREKRSHVEENDSVDGPERSAGGSESDTHEGTRESGGQFSVDSLPYKLRRQNVNEGREQVPYFLRPEITEREEGLKRTLEDDLGETVYKSDYREAAMVVAQRNPELVAEVLREWGYDLPR